MNYELLKKEIRSLADAEPWFVPLLSNASAAIFESLPDLNWAGFYLVRGGRLVLGPFQGKPACIHIEIGKGVCGTAVKEGRTVRVADVHDFPGHIACDSASNSEIVIPIRKAGSIIGVLDLDSPRAGRFSEEDEVRLQEVVRILEESILFEK